MSAAGVVQQKQRLRNHGVVNEAACKSLQAPMAKFFDEMLAHVRSLTGMRISFLFVSIPFLFVTTAFAGISSATAVLQLTVDTPAAESEPDYGALRKCVEKAWRAMACSPAVLAKAEVDC